MLVDGDTSPCPGAPRHTEKPKYRSHTCGPSAFDQFVDRFDSADANQNYYFAIGQKEDAAGHHLSGAFTVSWGIASASAFPDQMNVDVFGIGGWSLAADTTSIEALVALEGDWSPSTGRGGVRYFDPMAVPGSELDVALKIRPATACGWEVF